MLIIIGQINIEFVVFLEHTINNTALSIVELCTTHMHVHIHNVKIMPCHTFCAINNFKVQCEHARTFASKDTCIFHVYTVTQYIQV